MRGTKSREWARGLVGADRDAGDVAGQLRAGGSLIIAGPRGSGRSYLLRAVAAELERAGAAPVILRPCPTLTEVPFGAFDAADVPVLNALRQDIPAKAGGIVIIDDVDILDLASTAAILRAVAVRRLTVLLGLRTTRPRAVDPVEGSAEVRRRILDLWLDGVLARRDLGELTTAEAHDLVEQFPGADQLDSATRAGLIWRADGSRVLLRHLMLEAVTAAAAGRDPLRAVQNLSPQNRLSIALERHVSDFAEGELECLAAVHRLPHLDMAVATRLFPSDTVASLLSAGLLHADATANRGLTTNDVVAQAAERRLGSARVNALVDDAGCRMLSEADEWWSVAISLTIAERWHRRGMPGETPVDPTVAARVALDAAREANDRGDVAHAAAHAVRGLRTADDPALRLEAQFAAEYSAGAASADPSGLYHPRVRRRLARLQAERSRLGDEAAALRATAEADAAVEQLLIDSSSASADLDFEGSADAATRATMLPAASPAARLRALAAAGMAEAFRGSWSTARQHYREVERLLDSRSRPSSIAAHDRLSAVMYVLAGYHVAGADGSLVQERLERELEIATREGGESELTIGGAAASISFASQGRPLESQRELDVALARQPLAVSGPDATMIEFGVAEELAMSGRTAEARATLERLSFANARLLTHGLRHVETTILANEDRLEEARTSARSAAEFTRGTTAAALRIRDLFRLFTLGGASAEEVDELVQLAATTDLPLASEAVRRVSAHDSDEEGMPVDELRLHRLWSTEAPPEPGDGGRVERLPAHPAGLVSTEELTRREHEIAELVTEGLTNREIATRLFLSVRTVESHVYQARLKVGASSRRELGRMVAEGVVAVPTGIDER